MAAQSDPRERELPTGLVTFLLTDIEGSTALFQRLGEATYRSLLADHHRIIRAALSAHAGAEVKTEGDAFLAAFSSPLDAVSAALDAQTGLASHEWPAGERVLVRMGLHRGPAELGEGRDYVSLALHQAARVAAAPHGGQVLASASVTDELPDGDGRVRALGRFWLKDFAEPAPLFALLGTGDALDERPPRAARADFATLPAARSRLYGRDEAITDLERMLDGPGVVTVAGPGGVGKTRVAVELANRCAAAGREVCFVEFAPVGREEADSRRVATVIAGALGSSAGSVPGLAHELAGAELLLVLDNAEHLVDAIADCVDALSSQCPGLRVLVTTREPLGLDDEQVVRLEPLSTPQEDMSLVEAAATPAMQLFSARARAAGRGFALTEGNWRQVAELCRALDGVPLAIELAAPRASALGPGVLLERLRAVGDLPGDARRGKGARHSALVAVLDWSLSLCTGAEVAVLRRMGVFAGPVGTEGVVTVCGGDGLSADEVIDALLGLVDKSIVIVRESGPVPSYDLLATVRTAAAARLAQAGEHQEAVLRHARWVLSAAPKDIAAGGADLAAFKAIYSELLVALERGAAGDLPLELLIELLEIDNLALTVRVPQTAIRCGTLVAEQAPSAAQRAKAMLIVAAAMDYTGAPGSVEAAHEALRVARESGRPRLIAGALCSLHGVLGGEHATGSEAEAVLEELAQVVRGLDDDDDAYAVAMNTLGQGALARKDLQEARRCYQLSQARTVRGGPSYNLGVTYFNIAEIDELEERLEPALAGYQAAAGVFHSIEAHVVEAFTCTHLSGLLLRAGRSAEAVEAASDGVLAARRARSDQVLRGALEALVTAAEHAGDGQRAGSASAEVAALAA